MEIFALERGLRGIQQWEPGENLVVERSIEARPANTMRKSARVAPRFRQHAVQGLERERAARCALFSAQHSRGIQIRRNIHRVPGNVLRGIHEWRGPGDAYSQEFALCTR